MNIFVFELLYWFGVFNYFCGIVFDIRSFGGRGGIGILVWIGLVVIVFFGVLVLLVVVILILRVVVFGRIVLGF